MTLPPEDADLGPTGGGGAADLGWTSTLREFEAYLAVERGLSPHSVSGYLSDLRIAAAWAAGRDLAPPDLDRDRLTAFLVVQQGAGRAPRSMARMSSALRQFLVFLRLEGGGGAGPEAVVKAPRPPRLLPKTLSEAQVEALLAAPDTSTVLGLRDRAWLAPPHAPGLRGPQPAEPAAPALTPDQGFANG